MYIKALHKRLIVLQILIFCSLFAFSQEVPTISYNINNNGQVQLEVNSSPLNYYILKVRHHPDSAFNIFASLTLGQTGSTVISEALSHYPENHYQVLEYSIASPADVDEDGIDDITEYQNMPLQSPFNNAETLSLTDGILSINDLESFDEIAIRRDVVPWNEYLNEKAFVKYIIEDFDSEHPKIYFMNSNTYNLHADFANMMGINYLGDHIKKGHIIYHPTVVSSSGSLGTYAFNYSNAESHEFRVVQRTQELLAANMPFLENNLAYFINIGNEDEYNSEIELYQASRISVVYETDIYAEVDYWGLNQAEGYGLFRQMSLDETPGPRDIVLYESIPNSLPRVGGIMTSVIQTPLSHVNLRAIQDQVPNAFIRDPLSNDSILSLLNRYVYYKVEQSRYIIREATLEEVNHWYENMRPEETQIPPLNTDYKTILPLDEISFEMFDGFGAKCANIACMHTFGFPEGTIPDGFGVPFYFYQEFMTYNGLFDEIEHWVNQPEFKNDRDYRSNILEAIRQKIKISSMPQWMMDALTDMQESFPVGTSIRCRSSTNNEDLPGFSGAGLYTSKTQHPNEGHIAKSIKQVYASLWNLRAFEEREFYRVDHFVASMGVLCHPNYSNEKVNGVAVSTDPVYKTNHTLYFNSQLGEELITNPESNSRPEEILMDKLSNQAKDILVLQYSDLLPEDSLLMRTGHMLQLRDYLVVIHDEFEERYHAKNNPSFAIDIEYKITANDQLVIKQARPWVAFDANDISIDPKDNDMRLHVFPNPASEFVSVSRLSCKISELRVYSLSGRQENIESFINEDRLVIPIQNLASGVYIMSAYSEENKEYYSGKFVKN